MQKFFSIKEGLIDLDDNDFKILVTLYRNGMSHAFFLKRKYGLAIIQKIQETNCFSRIYKRKYYS